MGVEASIIVVLDGEVDDTTSIKVELDPNHANNIGLDGKLIGSFGIDSVPIFLIHHGSDVAITSVKSTDGIVSLVGGASNVNKTADNLFVNSDAQISIDYSSFIYNSVEWFGNVGSLYKDGSTIKVNSSSVFPCFGRVSYTVPFNLQYALTPPSLVLIDDEVYDVHIVVYATRT